MNYDEWDQQENEPDRAYAAFNIFKNIGPTRSIDKAWRIFADEVDRDKPIPTYFRGYSTKHKWADRCRAWDSHILKLEDEAFEKEAHQIRKTEKKNRLEMLKVLRALSAKAANAVIDEQKAIISKTSDIKNVASIIEMYLQQSRIEMGERAATVGASEQPTVTINNNLELGDAVANAKERLQSLITQKPAPRAASGDTERLQ